MTAGELIDYVRILTGERGQAAPTGLLLNLLNIAQDEVSRETRLPRKAVQYDGLTADNQLVLPADSRKEALVEAYQLTKDADGNVTDSAALPIYDFVTAGRVHPNWLQWEAADRARFLMYDPAMDPDCPRPAPKPSVDHPQSFRVVYVVQPTDATSLASEVLAGKFKGLSTVLAYRVAYLLTRDQAMWGEYEKAMRALNGQARPPTVIVKNKLYRAYLPGGERG